MKKIDNLWVYILGFGLILIFFGKLFYPEQSIFVTPDFGASDLIHFNYPLKEYLSESLKANRLPFWASGVGTGFPLLAEGQIGTFYIFNLILFKLLPTYLAFNLNYLISYLLAFVFTYLFGREIKLSKYSAIFTAIIFTFSGFISVHLHHFNLIQAVCLLPLIFYLTARLLTKPGIINSIFLAIALAQQVFTGHTFIVFITLLGVGSYIISSIFIEKISKSSKLKLTTVIIIALILAFGLSAIQTFPSWELKSVSQRAKGLSFDLVTSYPYPLSHLATLIDPYLLGDPRNGSYEPFSDKWGIFWENTFYLGLIPLFFILLSLKKIKKQKVIFFWGVVLISFLMVLGKNSPIYFIFYLPGFNLFRVTSKYLLLTTWSLSILGGFGLDILLNIKPAKKIKMVIVLVLISISFWQLFSFYNNYHPIGAVKKWLSTPASVKLLSSKDTPRIFAWGASKAWNSYFLTSGWQNLEIYDFLRNNLTANSGLLYNIANLRVNSGGLLPKRLLFLNYLTLGSKIDEVSGKSTITDNLLKIMSINSVLYVISAYDIDNSNLIQVAKIKATNIKTNENLKSFKIYKNKQALSRVRLYTADKIKTITTVAGLEKNLFDKDFIKSDYLMLEEQVKCNDKVYSKVKEGVKLVEDDQTRIVINSSSPGCRILYLADTHVPGWKAFVDGEETKIYVANINHKVIKVLPGKHEIKFIYEPPGFRKGLVVTLLTTLLAGLLVLGAFVGKGFYNT